MSINSLFIGLIFLLFALATAYYFGFKDKHLLPAQEQGTQNRTVENMSEKDTAEDVLESDVSPASPDGKLFAAPMDRSGDSITKKDFGMYITPETSPVPDENFRGFHTGVDWEVFGDEMDVEMPVKAVCSGKLAYKRSVSGYGGVVVQECVLEGAPITVVYGHMDLSSIRFGIGERMERGDIIGNLGAHKSSQTDGARKHLHLGIHKGRSIELRGYVNSNEKLSGWIDPCLFVCNDTQG
jgi:murein DD-endopeptidase MepM/ murein hydrolase activator NlpD